MEEEETKGSQQERRHRGGRCKDRDRGSHGGPKTFRRGRAIAFVEILRLKRSTIKQQLEQPEFQSIHQVLVGELKAIDMMLNEFIQLFEIHESEMKSKANSGETKGVEADEEN